MVKSQAFIVIAFLILLVAHGSGAAGQGEAARIEGRVTRGLTGEAVTGARLLLLGGESRDHLIKTDTEGRFRFPALAAGSYRLSIAANGYVPQRFGARLAAEAGKPIVVKAGETRNLAIALTPAATVSGHVRNGSGRPLAGVRVLLLRPSWTERGYRTFEELIPAVTETNDLGEFRIFWVNPGRYYLAAGGMLEDHDIRSSVAQENFTCTLHPGVTDFDKAAPIDLQPGDDLGGLDFTLTRQPLFRIAGHVVDGVTGRAPAEAFLSMERRDLDLCAPALHSPQHSYDTATGTFQASSLPPGTYRVEARSGSDDPAAARLPGAATIMVAANVNDVELRLQAKPAKPAITGRFDIEGELSADQAPATWLELRSAGAGPIPPVAIVSIGVKSGAFALDTAPEGQFRISAGAFTPGFYLKAVRLDDNVDLLTDPFSFPASGRLTVVLSSKGGRVGGVVRDAQSQPAGGTDITLIPSQSRDRTDRYKHVVADDAGRFSIEGIAPGNYSLFAWESIDPFSWFDPEVLRRFEQFGTPLHIEESSRQDVDIKRITAAGATP